MTPSGDLKQHRYLVNLNFYEWTEVIVVVVMALPHDLGDNDREIRDGNCESYVIQQPERPPVKLLIPEWPRTRNRLILDWRAVKRRPPCPFKDQHVCRLRNKMVLANFLTSCCSSLLSSYHCFFVLFLMLMRHDRFSSSPSILIPTWRYLLRARVRFYPER